MQPPKGNTTAMTLGGPMVAGTVADLNFLDTHTDTSEIGSSLVPFSEQLKHNTLINYPESTTESLYKKLRPEEKPKPEETATSQQIRA